MTLRVLVPTAQLAQAIQGPGIEAILWHINDSLADPPAADVLVTERPREFERRARVASIPGLRHVHLLSIGSDWILAHMPTGVTLSNSRGAVEDATAEHGMALILAALRELSTAALQQRRHDWVPLWTSSVHGSVVLILGYGGVGKELFLRLEPFRPAALIPVASRARVLDDGLQIHGTAELPDLLPHADVVVVTLPHDGSTAHLVDANFLARMKDGALLVNIGRGPVVDTEALLAELSSGRLRAALDVTDPEPLPTDHPLWDAPGCLITPHMAGNTAEFMRLATELTVDQIHRISQGEAPLHLVDVV